MLVFTKRQGAADVEAVQLMTASPNGGFTKLINKYDGTEDLLCVLWPGDDRLATTTLPATWDDGPNGQVRIAFPAGVMAVLDATWYSGLLSLVSDTTLLAEFRVEVESAPGLGTSPKTYHTYKDLVDELPFIGKLADQLNDQSGFIEVAADARRWIDGAILASAPTSGFGLISRQNSWDWNFGAGVGYGGYGYGMVGEDLAIAAALDADQLMLTTANGRRLVKASVYWTISAVLRRAVGMQSNNDLLTMASRYAHMADVALAGATAQIDTNADGKPEYVIPLGLTSTRRL